jgi:hypothetical protein
MKALHFSKIRNTMKPGETEKKKQLHIQRPLQEKK